MNDMTKGQLKIRQTIFDLHQSFPFVDKQNLMRCIMILFRGSVNPKYVEQIIDEVFDAN